MNLEHYQQCSNCVMDTTDPSITFNELGVCNYCINYPARKAETWFEGDVGQKQLIKKFDELSSSKNKYDCILGLSGGVDSSYLALLCKDYGLNPLVVHVDCGWNSNTAVSNIEKIVNYCNYELHTVVVDWKIIKSLQRSYIKSGVSNIDVPQDHAFFSALYKFAVKNKVKTVLSGGNFSSEGIFPVVWHEGSALDAKSIADINKRYENIDLRKYPSVSFYDYYFKIPFIHRMNTFRPLNYISYSKQNAVKELEMRLNWKNYGRKHGESIFTKVFQNDYLPRRFGYDKRLPHFSSLINAGQMKRNEAINLLREPLYDDLELANDLDFFCAKLDLSREEYETYIATPGKSYFEFKNWSKSLDRLKKVQMSLQDLTGKRIRNYS